MRLGVHIPCYKLTYFLPAVLRSVSWADRILITNSQMPWDDTQIQEDNTEQIVNECGMDNVELIKGQWPKDSEHAQRNIAMSLLSDMDYVLMVDSDEIMLRKDQEYLINKAQENPQIEAFGVRTIPYFNDLSHVALYDEGNTPLALVKPSVKFFITRCITSPFTYIPEVSIHHFKFLQPKEDIGWRVKAKHYEQQRKFNGVVPIEKNNELEEFMNSCGYRDFNSALQTIEAA